MKVFTAPGSGNLKLGASNQRHQVVQNLERYLTSPRYGVFIKIPQFIFSVAMYSFGTAQRSPLAYGYPEIKISLLVKSEIVK